MKNFVQKMTFLVLTIACYGNINAMQVIGIQSSSWPDKTRIDLQTGQAREVEMQVWYPAGWTIIGETVVENATPQKRTTYECHGDFTDFFETEKLYPYPVVFVAHYNKMSDEEYSSLCQTIARNNFVVITVKNNDENGTDKDFLADINFILNQVIKNSLQPRDLGTICNFSKIGLVTVTVTNTDYLEDDRIETTCYLFNNDYLYPNNVIKQLNRDLIEPKEQFGTCTIS